MRDMLDPDYEPECNRSGNTPFAEVFRARIGRRGFLQGSLGAAVGGLFASTGVAHALHASAGPSLGFTPVPVSNEDTLVVPEGYEAKAIYRWGDPITGSMPAYSPDNTGAQQGEQAGMHHDGMHFFPIEGEDPWQGSSTDGLLVVNHEYIEPRFLHAAAAEGQALSGSATIDHAGPRDPDLVLKEMNAHGVSIARIREDADGEWRIVPDPRNRRITGLTEMEIAGPVRGSNLVKTKFSPVGERTRGTLSNCAHGVTPWNTYMAAEENWSGYFVNTSGDLPREHARYGVRTEMSRYNWHRSADGSDETARFDATPMSDGPEGDYRNEPNTYGWMVEIDPFNPASMPVKRTTLGRFAHEGVVFAPAQAGQPIVCYSGDDARGEYIYKFVSVAPYAPGETKGDILDEGVLYAAKFNEDGSGEWLALTYGENGLDESNGFASQADVLVNTRTAADLVGATPMDRPEWGTVDFQTGAVYFTLTNNGNRTAEETDAANPRGPNLFGHIIRWHEDGGQASETFQWDLFVIAGPERDSADMNGEALDADSIFSSPDGLWMDANRRLWIQTDISESVMNRGPFEVFGNNMMLAANPETGEIRRFMTGPVGQETTGVVTTPDHRTMFINIQHPGATTSREDFAFGRFSSRWPDGGDSIPRSATVMIRRTDRGVVGA